MSKVHHLKSQNIESRSEVSTPTLSEIIEKIKLTDKLSEEERSQVLDLFEERCDVSVIIDKASEFASSDGIQFLIDLLSNYMR